jgi:hypothetical protein
MFIVNLHNSSHPHHFDLNSCIHISVCHFPFTTVLNYNSRSFRPEPPFTFCVSMSFVPPSLEEVISGECEAPYTLAQFASYLETFHCVENLEFILGMKKMVDLQTSLLLPVSLETTLLWSTIYQDFLLDSSPKEVNLPHIVKLELLRFIPHECQIPPTPLSLQSTKIVYEMLTDSYVDFIRHSSPGYRRISESSVPPNLNFKYIDLPKSPESLLVHEDDLIFTSVAPPGASDVTAAAPRATLYKSMPRPSFSHFHLEAAKEMEDQSKFAVYSLPSSLPSPKPATTTNSAAHADAVVTPLLLTAPSRNNSASSSSRGNSIGSIVESLKVGEHISWRRTVKRLKFRRFLNQSLDEEETDA